MTDIALTSRSLQTTVRAYGSAAVEYNALHTGVALFDRSHRGRLRLHGSRAAEMLNGLLSNDVAALHPGQGCYSAALTAKGKIVSDVRVFLDEHGALTDVPARSFAAWRAMVQKFVNPRFARNTDETAALGTIGFYGVNARHLVAELTGVQASALTALAPYAHVSLDSDGDLIHVVSSPDLAGIQPLGGVAHLAAPPIEGFDVILPARRVSTFWDRAVSAGALPAGLDAWDIARVEAGRPEWGIDMDDNTIPQEANFDELHAISYTKGCYVGQELVARVHFRGHVNKHLRGLHIVEPADESPRVGGTLHNGEGLQVGDVRSAVRSPQFGGIALAMIRREVEAGSELVLRAVTSESATSFEQRVVVSHLPFSHD